MFIISQSYEVFLTNRNLDQLTLSAPTIRDKTATLQTVEIIDLLCIHSLASDCLLAINCAITDNGFSLPLVGQCVTNAAQRLFCGTRSTIGVSYQYKPLILVGTRSSNVQLNKRITIVR